MKITVGIGGTRKGSFILKDEDLVYINLKSDETEAVVKFHYTSTFQYWLSVVGSEIEKEGSDWNKGIKGLSFTGTYWVMRIDTSIIHVGVNTSYEP